jgi:hypothetical protein
LCYPVLDNTPPEQLKCTYGAPLFAYQRGDEDSKAYGVTQGCCNHWDCPRCGQLLARKNYGRIVEGSRTLAKKDDLYFVTFTCRGRDISRAVAEAGYLKWTNRVLTAMRTRTKRAGATWAYVGVTERQKRGHPHSHLLTTYKPHDLRMGTATKYRANDAGEPVGYSVKVLRSDWLEARCIAAGLGPQYDISAVEDVEACSRYVAKYLFKDALLTKWPKGWRRVRYSQSWPQLPERKTNARVLLTAEDWYELAEDAVFVTVAVGDNQLLKRTLDGLYGHDVVVRVADENVQDGAARAPGLDVLMERWRDGFLY